MVLQGGSPTAPAQLPSHSGNHVGAIDPAPQLSLEGLKGQLHELLARRPSMPEASEWGKHAVESLQRELACLRLLHAEDQRAAVEARNCLQASEVRAARAVQALEELQSRHKDVAQRLASTELELATVREAHDAAVRQLGLVSSR